MLFQHVFTTTHELGVGCFIEVKTIRTSNQNVEIQPVSQNNWEHDYACSPNDNPYSSDNPYTKIAELTQMYNSVLRENRLLKRRCTYYRSKMKSYLNGNLPRSTREIVLKQTLKRTRTDAQIEMEIAPKKRQRCRNYKNEDFYEAYQLLNISKKAYQHARKNMIAYPCLTLLQNKFKDLHLRPGILKPILVALRHKRAQTANNPAARLLAKCFDECGLDKIAEYDQRLDCIVGKL